MKTLIYAAAAIAFVVPASANAQAHVEVHGGLDATSIPGGKDEGIVYGIAAGYDFPIGKAWFVGVEASLDDSTTKRCASNVFVAGDRACVSSGRDISAVARIGLATGDKGKVYALGGYTNARLKGTYDDGVRQVIADNADGLRLGAGYQHNFSGNVYGKIEYRYSNYQSSYSRHNGIVGVGITF